MTDYKVSDSDIVALPYSTGDLVESWIFASSDRDFSIYSERLLLRLVQVAQVQLLGANFRDGTSIGQVSIGKLGDVRVIVPIKGLLTEGDTNYSKAKKAIMELMRSPYFVERPKIVNGRQVYNEKGEPEFEFYGRQILNDADVNVVRGAVVLVVNSETWKAILDFSRGFRKYDIETALKLKRTTTLRLYKLLYNQKNPITFSIVQLRKMWRMDEKEKDENGKETGKYLLYDDTYDFIKRTIEPAKKELDAKSTWSFNYVKNTPDDSKAITSITFVPIHRMVLPTETSKLIRLTTSALSVLGREVYDLLVTKFEFTPKGLENNVELFYVAKKYLFDMRAFLDKAAPNALRANNPQGYVIQALRKNLTERFGIVFDIDGRFSEPQEETDN